MICDVPMEYTYRPGGVCSRPAGGGCPPPQPLMSPLMYPSQESRVCPSFTPFPTQPTNSAFQCQRASAMFAPWSPPPPSGMGATWCTNTMRGKSAASNANGMYNMIEFMPMYPPSGHPTPGSPTSYNSSRFENLQQPVYPSMNDFNSNSFYNPTDKR